MIIFWRGAGAGIIVFLIISTLIMHIATDHFFASDTYYQEHSWPLALSFAITALVTVLLGKFLNDRVQPVIDEQTGKEEIPS
jgi:CDP-diglyceride synthetase